MKNDISYSILYPDKNNVKYKQLSAVTCHDLGLDTICSAVTSDEKEQTLIMNILSQMTDDAHTSAFRQEVFVDILAMPELRKQMSEIFEKIEFIRNFGTRHIDSDEKLGFWHLMHRLDEIYDYIRCVETMRQCLSDANIKSEGLQKLKLYVDELYNDACFAEMKKDIEELKQNTQAVQSVTIGVNVNERFEAESMGLISVNSKPFKKSNIVSNFADALTSKNKIQESTDWDGDMHYQQVDKYSSGRLSDIIQTAGGFMAVRSNPFVDGNIRATVVKTPDGDGTSNSTFYLDKILNKMLDQLVKKLRDTLGKYADIAIVNITQLVPEFLYYIRFAEFIEKLRGAGFKFCQPTVTDNDKASMDAKGFYSLRLAVSLEDGSGIVDNDLVFDKEHTVYILTGANRGGKTTVTQGIGLLYAMAQGGIFVPADSFEYKPVDCIYTHFPADEDKTLDLGRLGEECVRFRELYSECTENSLVLLNETFSTTSFEEGYYIAKDSVKALLKKGVRTIYNTHMHKLAADADELNSESEKVKMSSLIVRSENGKRSFRIETASPEGLSYARDIAEKYGVTYEMLIG